MKRVLYQLKKLNMLASLSPALMEPLAIRLSQQAGKSLVISRERAREQTNRYARSKLDATE
jgi:hypothetical protein